MVLEATMICVDNSDWMRNEDYPPSRFEAQKHAFAILCAAKTQEEESMVGVLAMAAAGNGVLVTLTNDFSRVLLGMNGLQIGGEANLTAAIQVAQLALKNRKNKQLQQRIIVFVGSPVKDEKNLLEELGKKLKKNNVALDVVDFGESDDEKPEKLEALVAEVNSGGNSHIIHIPAGDVLCDVIISSPILSEDRGSDSAAAASGASGFEFGVDPNVDRELELLQNSMEEGRARQEAAKKAREESSKAESEGQSSTSNGDIAMADTEPEPNSYTEDKRLLHMDEDELSRQAQELSTEDSRCTELLEGVTDEVTSALQRTFQEEDTGTQEFSTEYFRCSDLLEGVTDVEDADKVLRQAHELATEDFRYAADEATSALQNAFQKELTETQSDASKVFGDQPFARSLPDDVEFLNDLSNKDHQLERKEQLIGPSEVQPKRQHKKYKRHQKKKPEKKHEKEDEPEGDKSQ